MSVSIQHTEGGFALSGDLSFATVGELFQQTVRIDENTETAIDLARINKIDSAGVALLVEWARRAKVANGSVVLKNLSEQGRQLIDVANLKNMFS